MDSLRVFMEDDPEIRDDWHIVFEVWVPSTDVPDYYQSWRRWTEALIRIVPTTLGCIFRLTLLTRKSDTA